MKLEQHSHSSGAFWILLVCILVTVFGMGYYYYAYQKEQITRTQEEQLTAIADLKVKQILAWRQERVGNAQVIYQNIVFSELVQRLLRDPHDADVKGKIESWITKMFAAYAYNQICLHDVEGRYVLSTEATNHLTSMTSARGLREAATSGNIIFQDFYRDENDGNIYLTIFVPIKKFKKPLDVIAVLALRIDPKQNIYPLIEAWPTVSKTSETLLVERDSTNVVFLNELRHLKNTALKMHRPIDAINLPASIAARGIEGIVKGSDYRNIPVIAMIRKVEGTPWSLIAKVDADELFAPIAAEAREISAIGLLLVIVIVSSVQLLWNRVENKYKDSLLESEIKFRHLFDYSAIGKSITSLDGTVNVNKAFCTMLGYSKEELCHIRWQDISHPDDIEVTNECLHTLQNGEKESTRFVKRYLRKDGDVIWGDVSTVLQKDDKGMPLYYLTAVMDITERIRADAAQESQNALLWALINSPGDIIIFSLDAKYCYTAFNEKHRMEMKQIWGVDIEIGMSLLDCMSMPSLRSAAQRSADRSLTGEAFTEIQHQPDHDVYYEFSWNPIYQHADIVGVTVFIRNITERKQAEQKIRELNATLERRVLERTAALEEAIKELGAFSYSVSHDLRAPLRHLNGYVELLKKRFPDALPPQGKHYLDTITDAAHQMGDLIDDLLQFSRTGRQEMHRASLDMNELVNDVVASMQHEVGQRGIEWSIAAFPQVVGDHALLRLVWVNLLSNAVKFTRKKEKARIDIGWQEDSEGDVFFVRDNGAGFDMRYAQKLFGVFQRLHSEADFEGTGIGLANVRRIVLKHGGRTWAEAEQEKGATFYFSLPRRCETGPVASAAASVPGHNLIRLG